MKSKKAKKKANKLIDLRIFNFSTWIKKNPPHWVEVWVQWDDFNYIISATVLTIQIGYCWKWLKRREIKKSFWRKGIDRIVKNPS